VGDISEVRGKFFLKSLQRWCSWRSKSIDVSS
jgi:hypothetical protein